MLIIKFILLCYLLYFGINSIFVEYIDKKTRFKNDEKWLGYFDTKFRLFFIFFGLPCLLFKKRIKKARKEYYYKKRLEHLKQINFSIFGNSIHSNSNMFDKEILHIERYFALKKLNKK